MQCIIMENTLIKLNLCQHANMYEHVKVETLSGAFNAIFGGNVYNVMLHVYAATLRGLTPFIFVSYII